MGQFTVYRGESVHDLNVAEKLRAVGGKVISEMPGLALVETASVGVNELRQLFKDWIVTEETAAAQRPQPRPTPPMPPRRPGKK